MFRCVNHVALLEFDAVVFIASLDAAKLRRPWLL
jgi:hypothetical protein